MLFLNYSGCNGAILKMAAEEGNRVISREPPNSVLTLTDVTGTSFDQVVELLRSSPRIQYIRFTS